MIPLWKSPIKLPVELPVDSRAASASIDVASRGATRGATLFGSGDNFYVKMQVFLRLFVG